MLSLIVEPSDHSLPNENETENEKVVSESNIESEAVERTQKSKTVFKMFVQL